MSQRDEKIARLLKISQRRKQARIDVKKSLKKCNDMNGRKTLKEKKC